MTDLTTMGSAECFSSWQSARLARTDLKPMGAAGWAQAELVWRHWLGFCTVHALAWDTARCIDIATFCQGISPRSSSKKTSPVTRRRYWRVLRDLYDHALARCLVETNPAKGAQPPATERAPSLALPASMWAALHEGLYENFPGGDDFKARRNRLALLLMMGAALTVREIVGLTLDCAQSFADTANAPAGQAPVYTLYVRKNGGTHERTLLLDPETSRALHAWLEVRPVGLPALRQASRLIVGSRIGRSIAPNGLYNICHAHLARCLVDKGFLETPSPIVTADLGTLAHMGPNTLRNTCIAGWFNAGMPLQEIQRRCNFKDASVMSRLGAHLVNPFPR